MPDDPQVDALKLPPHSIEAEQSVLGGLLLDNDAADRIGDVVSADDFYADAHRVIFAAALRLIESGSPADVVTVSEALDSTQKLDYVGGLAYLGTLVQNVPTAANIRHYAAIVRERSILRQLASTAGEIADAAYNPLGRSAREVLDVAEAKVLHIAEQGSRGQHTYSEIGTLLAGVVERIEDLYNREDPSDVTGVATGFSDLDRQTAGLQPGDLVVVAGRPSMGKAQPLDARVLGRGGWKAMGELVVGDALAAADGRPSIVTGVYPQGEREIFRVTFTDGRTIVTGQRIELVVPVMLRSDGLESALVLGPKRSEEPYTHEDLDLLRAIASSLAPVSGPGPSDRAIPGSTRPTSGGQR